MHYIVDLARNARLQQITEFLELAMKDACERSGIKPREVGEVGEFVYARQISTQIWACERRMITRLEYGAHGSNPRYVMTNLTGGARYDDWHCQRGKAENRIKEAQVGLFATHTSCQYLRSNQLLVLPAALGYVLIERLRALALRGTALASAQVDTRRIRLYLATNWPSADIFAQAMRQLRSP